MVLRLCIFSIILWVNIACSSGDSIYWSEKDTEGIFLLDTISLKYIKSKDIPYTEDLFQSHDTLKGETYHYTHLFDSWRAFVVKQGTTTDGYIFKLLCGEVIGENDNPIRASLLYIYKNNQLTDRIVLSLSLTFEAECFSKFIVSKHKIFIDRYEVEHLLYDEDGNIIGPNPTPDTLVTHHEYNITDGMIVSKPQR